MKFFKKRVHPAQTLPNGKKALTKSVVDHDFFGLKNPWWSYILSLIWLGAIIAFSYYYSPVCYLCAAVGAWKVFKETFKDRKRRKKEYFIILRPCHEKKILTYDDSPDEYSLWFLNQKEDLYVAVTVDKEYYDKTETDEEFYIVFAPDEKYPWLWYRTSEWELDTESWK